MEHDVEWSVTRGFTRSLSSTQKLAWQRAVQVVPDHPRVGASRPGGEDVALPGLDHEDPCPEPQQLNGHVAVPAAQLQHASSPEEILPEEGPQGVQPLPAPGDVVGVPEDAHEVGMEPHCSYCAWVSANCGPGPDEEGE